MKSYSVGPRSALVFRVPSRCGLTCSSLAPQARLFDLVPLPVYVMAPKAKAPREQVAVDRANRLKAAVINAVAYDEPGRLLGLLRQISSLSPSAGILRETGFGVSGG